MCSEYLFKLRLYTVSGLKNKNKYPFFVHWSLYQPYASFHCSDIEMSDESKLIQHLLYRYERVSPLARPVKDSSHAVSVEFQMTLVQILDFDETKQLIISNIWKSYVSLLLHGRVPS